jgi:hypothetical protein
VEDRGERTSKKEREKHLKNRRGELEEARKEKVEKMTRNGNKETGKIEEEDVGYK